MPSRTFKRDRAAMTAIILGSLFILAGCKQKPAADNAANAVAAPVTLPPPISRSLTYRCKDNSLVYVDLFADDLSANLRTSENGPITHLVAQTPGGPFASGGYVLSGTGEKADVMLPGKAAQSCRS